MGWTLFACFGCTNERKRPRSSKLGQKSRRIKGYQQLQSDVSKELNEDLRDKPTDEKKARIRKKVRFNLDVIIYEPISDYYASNLQEETNEKGLEEEPVCLVYAPERAVQSFPSSYRYNNCYGDDDYHDKDENEDEDSECELSELEDDDDDDNVVNGGSTDAHYHDLSCRPLISSADKGLRTTTYGQSRRHYVVPVLNPIENLSQWKALKARKC